MVTVNINGIDRHFKLEADSGCLWLVAVDETGEYVPFGNILYIDYYGFLRRCSNVGEDTGVITAGDAKKIAIREGIPSQDEGAKDALA